MIASRMLMFGAKPDGNVDTAVEMTIPAAMIASSGYGTVNVNVEPRAGGPSLVTLDWGDGTVERVPAGKASHRYEDTERHVIRIGGEARWFRFLKMTVPSGRYELTYTPLLRLLHWGDRLESASASFSSCASSMGGGLVGPLPPWGKSMTDVSFCFEFCSNLTGAFPEWTDAITTAYATYRQSTLSGALPAWGAALADVTCCYGGCKGATGVVPAWREACQACSGCYEGCTGLTGGIPAWPATAGDVSSVYFGCTGLTGDIPPWPYALTKTANCYGDCSGLTGAWTTDPALLMPYEKVGGTSSASRYWDTVYGCAATLRALFYEDWGGTRAK